MRLIINGFDIELRPKVTIAKTLQVNDIGSIATRQASYTNTFSIPKTANNTRAFSMLGIVGNNSNIPYQKNECYLYSDSGECLVYKGWAIISVTDDNFKCNVYDGVVDLYKSIENKTLADLNITALTHEKTPDEVVSTFGLTKPYAYILADYNGKAIHTSKINTDYLIPSVKASWLLQKIEEFSGYQINGEFKTSTDFTNLFLSYPKGTPPVVGASILTSTNVIPNTTALTPSNRLSRVKVSSPSVIDSTKIIVAADGLSLISQKTQTLRVTFVINPSITVTRANGSFYTAFGSFNGEQFLCDGTTRTIFATYKLVNGQSISFDFELSFNNFNDNGVTISDFYTSIDVKEVNSNTFETEFSGMSIKQFLNEFLWRFNLTAFKKQYSNEYVLKTLKEIIETKPIVWSDKFVSVESENYIVGSYAQRNWLRHKYNDENSFYNDGYFDIQNENLSDTKTSAQSVIYSPDFSTTSTLGFTSNVYRFWNKEIKDDNTVTYKELANRFYFLRALNSATATDFTSEILAQNSSSSNVLVENFARLSFKEVVDNYYQEMSTILNKSKELSVTMRLTEIDIINFDFSVPVYIKQLGGSFLVNKINNFIPFQNTKVDLIRLTEVVEQVQITSTINALPDTYSFNSNATQTLLVLVNDDLGTIPTTITNIDLLGGFSLGTLSINAGGQSVSFIPNGSSGSDTFKYRITDSTGFISEAEVTITNSVPPYEIIASSMSLSAFTGTTNKTGTAKIIVNIPSAKFRISARVMTGSGTAVGNITIGGNTRSVTATSSSKVYSPEFTLTQGEYDSSSFTFSLTASNNTFTVAELLIEYSV